MALETTSPIERKILRRRTRLVAMMSGLALTLSACGSPNADSSGDGCDTFGVYAQNRFPPSGASVRQYPDVLAPRLEPGFAGNEVVAVDAWTHATVAYSNNQPPFNGDEWFRLANRPGWVNIAAVRAVPTVLDPTGFADGGIPAPTTPECQITYKP